MAICRATLILVITLRAISRTRLTATSIAVSDYETSTLNDCKPLLPGLTYSESYGGGFIDLKMKIKTVKALIKILDEISEIDRNELKGIKSEEQSDCIGVIRASIQNELDELKELSK